MTRNKGVGFTLIEVLVVVGIIVVLAGIILSVVPRVKEKGKQTACLSNVRQLGTATLMYMADNDRYPPPFRNLWPGDLAERTDDGGHGFPEPELLHAALMPYVGDPEIWYCPSDPLRGQDVEKWYVNHLFSSYGFHFRRDGNIRDDGFWSKVGGRKIEEPSECWIVFDSNQEYVLRGEPDPTPGCEHFRGINVAYLDGHAKFIRSHEDLVESLRSGTMGRAMGPEQRF